MRNSLLLFLAFLLCMTSCIPGLGPTPFKPGPSDDSGLSFEIRPPTPSPGVSSGAFERDTAALHWRNFKLTDVLTEKWTKISSHTAFPRERFDTQRDLTGIWYGSYAFSGFVRVTLVILRVTPEVYFFYEHRLKGTSMEDHIHRFSVRSDDGCFLDYFDILDPVQDICSQKNIRFEPDTEEIRFPLEEADYVALTRVESFPSYFSPDQVTSEVLRPLEYGSDGLGGTIDKALATLDCFVFLRGNEPQSIHEECMS